MRTWRHIAGFGVLADAQGRLSDSIVEKVIRTRKADWLLDCGHTYEYQRAVETKEQVVVGVNDFIAEQERGIPTLRIDPQIEREQIQRLQALRTKRDANKAKVAMAELERRTETKENLLPAILAAVEAYCTVGEISDTLRRAFGEYQESVVI